MPEQNTDNTIFSIPFFIHCHFLVGNVPYDAQEEELKRICQKIGPIRSIKYAPLFCSLSSLFRNP